MENTGIAFPEDEKPAIYLAGMDAPTRAKAFEVANQLRVKGICVEIDHLERSVKAQFKYADKLGAQYVGVIGSSELENGIIKLKKMSDGSEYPVAFADIYDFITHN
jgi:histidyl-tRNA synthetase